MKCPLCDNLCVAADSNDSIKCDLCGAMTNIVTYTCESCGTKFKTLNDEVIEYTEASYTGEQLDSNQLMSDYIHKCIKCNSLSFEFMPGKFRCSKCEFEWEVA